MATKKTTKPIIHIDEDAETRINLAMAKAAGAKSAWDLPEFKDFGKTPSKKTPEEKDAGE